MIHAFESDLKEISSKASLGLFPRQVVEGEINNEQIEELGKQNFNGNLEEGIAGMKKFTSGFIALEVRRTV